VPDDLHQLTPVELDFLDVAPYRFEFEEPVAAPPARVWAAISADPSTWTWFPGIEEGAYEPAAGAPGVGTRRWVRIGGVKYRETMLAWDEPHRWAYRVDETSAPLFVALLEDWRIEPGPGETTVMRWTFAFEPRSETAEMFAGASELIGSTFGDAMRGLDARLG